MGVCVGVGVRVREAVGVALRLGEGLALREAREARGGTGRSRARLAKPKALY